MKKKEKTEIKIKTQKGKKIQKPKKFKTQKENKNKNKPRKLFFNLTLSLPLTFRVFLFLPRSLLSSSHLEGFSSLSILAFGPQIGMAQISMEALGRWDSDRRGLVSAHGQSWLVVGEVVVACRGWGGHGSPWVVLAHCGSVGFDGLARLDLMVAGLASVVVGLVQPVGSWLGRTEGYGSWVLHGSLKTEGYGSQQLFVARQWVWV